MGGPAMNEHVLLFDIHAGTDAKPKIASSITTLSHRDDPETSHEAARKLSQSGRLTGQRRAVLEALRQCNGATHAELGEAMGVHWLTPARRLPELERIGLVRRGEPRLCRVKGSRCTAWFAEEAGQ